MAALVEEARRATLARSVVIIGRRSVQNALLAGFIDERLGCVCQVKPIYQVNGGSGPRGAVALLDVEGMSARDIDAHVRTLFASACYRGIALMNADENAVEELVRSPGVQGVFFRDTGAGHLVKGIQAILDGEYWLPRSLLAAHFEKARRQRGDDSPVEVTRQESAILELLATGYRNGDIARRLGLSPHTIKTHLYNAFRKIGAKNRVQAVNWLMQNR